MGKLKAILGYGVCLSLLTACAIDKPSEPNKVNIYTYKLSSRQVKDKIGKQVKKQQLAEHEQAIDDNAIPADTNAVRAPSASVFREEPAAVVAESATDKLGEDYAQNAVGDSSANGLEEDDAHGSNTLSLGSSNHSVDYKESEEQAVHAASDSSATSSLTVLPIGNIIAEQEPSRPQLPVNAVQKLDKNLEQEAQKLFIQLRCLSCEKESLASSSALFAKNLRGWIFSELQRGKDIEVIKRSLVERYGQRILLHRDFAFKRGLLWLVPILVFLILGLIAIYSRKSRPKRFK